MSQSLSRFAFGLSFFILAALSGCTKAGQVGPTSTSLTELPIGTSIAVVTATATECPTGGLALETFQDSNRNGLLDLGETVVSRAPVCNGSKGDQGVGAGVVATTAPSGACPAGGTQLTTYSDVNNDGVKNSDEAATSVSTICNGVNSVLTSTAANSRRRPVAEFRHHLQRRERSRWIERGHSNRRRRSGGARPIVHGLSPRRPLHSRCFRGSRLAHLPAPRKRRRRSGNRNHGI
jgi:hypothetical protein